VSGDLCFIVDVNLAWLKYPLRRRGFIVYAPCEDYPETAEDIELLEWARRLGCYVVSSDKYFRDKDHAIYVPHWWNKKYNSWEIATKVIKMAGELRHKVFKETQT